MTTAAERAAIAQAYRLAELLEAAAKGLRHKRHQRTLKPATAKIESVIRRYFQRYQTHVQKALKPRISGALAEHPPKLLKEASSDGKMFSRQLLPATVAPLSFPATTSENEEYQAAIAEAISGAAATLLRDVGGSGNPDMSDFASRYLRENSLSKLTGELNPVSVERLQNGIANAWDAGGSYEQIVDAVHEVFADFSDVRAGLIAQTEANDAYNAGREATARAAGLGEKAWETESDNPCEVCLDNEAEGWIDIDDPFPSGDMGPTAHPNCECVLNFRTSENDEE